MRDAERMTIGAVGCGYAFRRLHSDVLRASADWRLSSVCDPQEDNRTLVLEREGSIGAYASFDEMLKGERLDAVLIASPPGTHAALVVQALNAGLHVLVEKPLATSAAQATQILDASARSDKQVLVGFNRRFRRTYRDLRDAMAGLGGAVELDCVLRSDAAAWGAASSATQTSASDRFSPLLHDLVSHQVDLVPWLWNQPLAEVRINELHASDSELRVDYEQRAVDGRRAKCTAAWAGHYAEHVFATGDDARVVALAEATFGPTKLGLGSSRLAGALFGRAGQITRRISGKASLTRQSIGEQLDALAARVRGDGSRHSDDAADVNDGARAAAAVDACVAGCGRVGEWIEVEQL